MGIRSALCRLASHKKGAVGENVRPYPGLMKRGFTVPELLLVLAVAGILLGIAIPQLSQAWDRVQVEAAASHLVAAHQRARIMAIARGLALTLTIDSAALTITPRSETAALWARTRSIAFRGVSRRPSSAGHVFTGRIHPGSLERLTAPRARVGHSHGCVFPIGKSEGREIALNAGRADGPFGGRRARTPVWIRAIYLRFNRRQANPLDETTCISIPSYLLSMSNTVSMTNSFVSRLSIILQAQHSRDHLPVRKSSRSPARRRWPKRPISRPRQPVPTELC